MKPPIPKLNVHYRRQGGALPALAHQLEELRRFADSIRRDSPLLERWFLASGDSEAEALRTLAIDERGVHAAARDELRRADTPQVDSRAIALWNGATGRGQGATLSSLCSTLGRPDWFEFGLKLEPDVRSWQTPARWIRTAVSIWPTALFATFAPLWHSERRIFQDRPGVGWMIYLPRAITAAQVPEARQLVPVNAPDGSPRGTIVVSVTEGGYSDDNPEHLATAQAIETRLVDLDLLPRFADL
jgi:hypothetical protein